MNRYESLIKKRIGKFLQVFKKLGLSLKCFFIEQFNRNIYTRILLINVICFVLSLSALIAFFDFSVKQVAYNQIQQELLRKAKRANFALLQKATWNQLALSEYEGNNLIQSQQEQIKFLSDIFDAKITIFDKSANIVATSAKQEIVPGSQVDKSFAKTISMGETMTAKIINKETKELTFIAVVPMGDSNDIIVNGILLEATPSKLDHNIAKMRLCLILVGIFILIIIIFISVYQAIFISKPISRLSTSMAELNSGNYVRDQYLPTLDEVKALTDQFNKLAEKMQKIQEENKSIEGERTRLFSEISHELRTPLTAVQGFVEAIQDGIVQDKDLLDKYLEIIYTQTIHINRLVDDMLQLSRLESSSMKLEKSPLNLVTLAHGVVESMEALVQTMNITIIFEKNTDQAMILGDTDRIEQIIRNLLQNAINATGNGKIIVRVEDSPHSIILTVKDNGIGISSDDLPHIWDRFYQNKSQRNAAKAKRGSGLGLVIVKQLVLLHNGKIEVESQPGIGTTFCVYFPAL
ncbi:sensor histidine kinase [Lutispora sp.]|uniref:sensor histidine kinase n=1 Tax=Lutispora sp. TaxID=2828727 RepID=UPI002B1EE46F|nr:HAMP domain-containing sensor histidine kinase [Lutispora sp.]MEA4963412.1 HAMP domain-containing sensor histidine kinase [Lutispora sp.]